MSSTTTVAATVTRCGVEVPPFEVRRGGKIRAEAYEALLVGKTAKARHLAKACRGRGWEYSARKIETAIEACEALNLIGGEVSK